MPAAISLGNVAAGSNQDIEFVLKNFRSRDLRILAVKPSCSCMVVNTVPSVIPAHGLMKIQIKLSVSPTAQPVAEEIIVISDDDSRPFLPLKITGVAELGQADPVPLATDSELYPIPR